MDFDAIRSAHCPIELFLSATNVRAGKIRVFENDEIGPDAVLASACLPFLFQAIEIGGEHYWDGGYLGNPAIFPLIYNCDSRDVVIVHINPIETIKRMLIHSIEADDVMQSMSVGVRSTPTGDLVNKLMKVGRERAGAWIVGTFDRLGKESTTDIHEKYL